MQKMVVGILAATCFCTGTCALAAKPEALTPEQQQQVETLLERIPTGYFEVLEYASQDGRAEIVNGHTKVCLKRKEWRANILEVLRINDRQTAHMDCTLLQREITPASAVSRLECRQRKDYGIQGHGELRDALRITAPDKISIHSEVETLQRSLDGAPEPDLRRTTRLEAKFIGDCPG